jgi:hypothetical protein
MPGDEARFVSEPFEVDFSCACQVCAPVVAVAVAPGPPPAVEPYVIVNVFPAASVKDETVMVWPETETVPELAVVYPAFAPVVEGAVHPLGTTSVTEPFDIPPAAAV